MNKHGYVRSIQLTSDINITEVVFILLYTDYLWQIFQLIFKPCSINRKKNFSNIFYRPNKQSLTITFNFQKIVTV